MSDFDFDLMRRQMARRQRLHEQLSTCFDWIIADTESQEEMAELFATIAKDAVWLEESTRKAMTENELAENIWLG